MSPRRGEPIGSPRSAEEARELYARLVADPRSRLWELAQANRDWLAAIDAERAERERRLTYVRPERARR